MDERAVEPYQIDHVSRLQGTVNYYNRHIIVCSGRSDWSAKIQDDGGFVKALSLALGNEVSQNVFKLTACDLPKTGEGKTVLIFPDQVRISGLLEETISYLVNYLQYGEDNDLSIVPFEQHFVLVCTHEKRDVRCGLAAPGIIQKMKTSLEQQGLSEQVVVAGSSHLGGHKFAGVAVVYPSGNWYGRLTEQDAARIIEAEYIKKQPYPRLWRGRMGLSVEAQVDVAEAAGWIVLEEGQDREELPK